MVIKMAGKRIEPHNDDGKNYTVHTSAAEKDFGGEMPELYLVFFQILLRELEKMGNPKEGTILVYMIAKNAGISLNTAYNALSALEKYEYLKKIPGDGKKGTSVVILKPIDKGDLWESINEEAADETDDENRKSWIFRLKICYCVFISIFSIVFLYLSGIKFKAEDFHNKRVEALLFGLVMGIILIYINMFWADYPLADKLLSSFAYLFCLCLISFFFKPLLYDLSSYSAEPSSRAYWRLGGHMLGIFGSVTGLVIAFIWYIQCDGGFLPKI
jgi:hypothetical protein